MSQAVGEKLAKLRTSYTEYLINHVDVATWTESWMKTLSYLVAGKISKSHSVIIAELMYSSSSLLTLMNDYLLRQHHNLHNPQDDGSRPLKMLLSAVEAIEVFVEIAARHYGNSRIRWLLIFCLQLFKTVGRFLLLHKHKIGIRHFPLVKKLNRKMMTSEADEREEDVEVPTRSDSYYTLEGSGRRIKSVSAKYKMQTPTQTGSGPLLRPALTDEQIFAESLHNLQPLIHLSTAAFFGQKSWIPWLISLATDYSSIAVLRQKKYEYKKSDNAELLRRRFVLLMYLLRSPCYDKYTKVRLMRLLTVLSRIPGAGYIMTSLIEYLPEWQSTYFYTWNS